MNAAISNDIMLYLKRQRRSLFRTTIPGAVKKLIA